MHALVNGKGLFQAARMPAPSGWPCRLPSASSEGAMLQTVEIACVKDALRVETISKCFLWA